MRFGSIQRILGLLLMASSTTMLPPLLLALEADAGPLWQAFLQLAGPEGEPHAAWKAVETAWFADGALIAEQAETGETQAGPELLQDVHSGLSKLVRESLEAGPPDTALAAQLRTTLLLAEEPAADAAEALYIVSMVEVARGIRPSARGELEITDVNNAYISRGEMEYEIVDGWWMDAGEDHEALLRANIQVARQQGIVI